MTPSQGSGLVTNANTPMVQQPGRGLRWLACRPLGATATAALENELAPGGFVPLHSHDVEELLLCRAGSGALSLDGTLLAFADGDTMVVTAGCVHGFRNTGDLPMRVLAFFPSAAPAVSWVEARYAGSWGEQ